MRAALAVWKLYPSFFGGAERHALLLARALGRCGVEVDVICAARPRELPPDAPFRVIPVGWHDHLPDLLASALFSQRAASVIETGRYDVAYGQNLALWKYARGRVPVVMNPHGLEPMFVRELWPRVRGTWRRRAFRLAARRARRVVSLGGRLSEYAVSTLRIPLEKVVVIPNAIDVEEIDDRLRAVEPGPRQPNSLLYVGRLAANKGIDVLFNAMRTLPPAACPTLFLVGGGPLESSLRSIAPPQVRFLGRLPDHEVSKLLRAVDGLVLPSLYEGMPTVILEALAHSTPVIATDIGAVATMLDDSTGFLVPPGDTRALASAIATLTSLDERRRRTMGERGRERVRRSFTWAGIAEQTVALFRELCSADAASSPGS